MKTYLCFKNDGEIIEFKTNYKNKEELINELYQKEYSEYTISEFKDYYFLIFYNKNNKEHNLCNIPFIKFKIYDSFIIYKIDRNDLIISFTEKQLLNIIDFYNKKEKLEKITDYSSDDFD